MKYLINSKNSIIPYGVISIDNIIFRIKRQKDNHESVAFSKILFIVISK